MKIIAIVESDDYSGAAIVDPSYITITKISDFYLAATSCLFSDMPADKLMAYGVKCFDINETNEPIKKNKQKKD